MSRSLQAAVAVGAALVAACAGVQAPEVAAIEPSLVRTYRAHLGPAWFEHRARRFGITAQEARERDADISALAPPPGFWDEEMATEAAAIWTGLCNDCHGGRRSIREARQTAPPPAAWPKDESYFFGRRRHPQAVFQTILTGGPEVDGKASEMPAWGNDLAREQIWALVWYVETQSGGTLGQFPPGLYPHRDAPTQ